MTAPGAAPPSASLTGALRRHALLIAATAVVAFIAAWAISSSLTPTYEATATVTFAEPVSTRLQLSGASIPPDRALSLRARRAQQAEVLQAATDALGGTAGPIRSVDVSSDTFLNAIRITASDDDAEGAAAAATAVAQAVAEWEERDAADAVDGAVERLEVLVERAGESVTDLTDAAQGPLGQARLEEAVSRLLAAQQQIADLRLQQAIEGSGVNDVQPATVPESPVSPKPLRDASVAALMAAIAVGGLMWYRRSTISERIGLAEKTMGAPVITTAPTPSIDALEDPERQDLADALFRMLAHSLNQVSASTLTITSAVPLSSEVSLASELGHAGARLGRRTLLVDAAVDRPHGRWCEDRPTEHEDHPGDGAWTEQWPTAPLGERLSVVSLAEIAEDRRAASLGELLSSARLAFDVIIVDAPPTTEASASMALESAEAVVVEAPVAVGTEQLSSSRRTLDLLGARCVGLVLRTSGTHRTSEGGRSDHDERARVG